MFLTFYVKKINLQDINLLFIKNFSYKTTTNLKKKNSPLFNYKKVEVNSSVYSNPVFKLSNKLHLVNFKFSYKLFLTYLTFNQLKFTTYFNSHPHFKLLFQSIIKKSVAVINTNSFYKRWSNTYLFLYNLFYYKSFFLLFGPQILKLEILSFNFSHSNPYTQSLTLKKPLFFFKDTFYGWETLNIFEELQSKKLNTYFILDILKHPRTLFYLRSTNAYTIGLIGSNQNPWTVSYPIPSFTINLFLQYFFLKLLTFIRRSSISNYKLNLRNSWLSNF